MRSPNDSSALYDLGAIKLCNHACGPYTLAPLGKANSFAGTRPVEKIQDYNPGAVICDRIRPIQRICEKFYACGGTNNFDVAICIFWEFGHMSYCSETLGNMNILSLK